MSTVTKGIKKLKPGINTPLICKRCGHKMGTIRLRQRVKWKMIWWGLGIGFIFEFITNLLVYLIFKYI